MEGGPRPVRFEEIPQLQGRRSTGEPFTVERAERDLFERVTWLDRAYPEPDPPEFPADIVEGFHVLALLDAVSAMAMPFDRSTAYGYNYGLDRVRFVSPVMVGDRVVPSFEVLEVRPKGDGYLILRRCELQVEGGERPALVADWWVYLLPRLS
jgi:carnitine-CoA ligase